MSALVSKPILYFALVRMISRLVAAGSFDPDTYLRGNPLLSLGTLGNFLAISSTMSLELCP